MGEGDPFSSCSENHDKKRTRRLCLVTMIGLPCSGKTTLSKNLQLVYSRWNDINLLPISYDDFVPLETQKTFPSRPLMAKCIRRNFVSTINFMAKELGITESHGKDFRWKSFSSSLSADADEFLPKETFVFELANYFKRNEKYVGDHSTDIIILIDDNNYYKSMRHEFFTIAREQCMGFCLLYCHAPVDICLQRNAKREQATRVPDSVILDMDKKLEEPDLLKNECDTYCLQVGYVGSRKSKIRVIHYVFTRALENPVSPLPLDRTEVIEKERKICSENAVHQADLILRKWLHSELIVSSTTSAKSKKQLSQEMVQMKRLTLEKLRSGEIVLRYGVEDEFEYRNEILEAIKNIKLEKSNESI